MKYLSQLGIILSISFAGELIHALVPLPVPASIYGIVLLFLLLYFHVIRTAQIREVSILLISVMAFLFVPAAVGLIGAWDVMKASLGEYIVINVLTMICCMAGAGHAAQLYLARKRKE